MSINNTINDDQPNNKIIAVSIHSPYTHFHSKPLHFAMVHWFTHKCVVQERYIGIMCNSNVAHLWKCR